ncbi:MAG: N-acetylmuramoyl-L-alanine amidase [Sporomusaceae bacterium]|nr:N-acetylmuramoyl-L-alanine amidase [Sporomusaceae bacterium]
MGIWCLLLWCLMLPQVSLADPAKAEITAVRSGPFVDNALGTDVMRYVFDVSRPVAAEAFIVTGGSTPRLSLLLKGAVPAAGAELNLADSIVSRTAVSSVAGGTQVLLDLKQPISRHDFKVFTLPANAAAKKGFRVVVDINRTPRPVSVQPAKPAAAGAELLQLRSYTHVDAVTGERTMRLVLDTGVPVAASASFSATPVPRLLVDVKGAVPGKIEREYKPEGGIIDRAAITAGTGGSGSRLVVDLPLMLEPDDYKLFTLPADPKADRPFRVVLDVKQKTPPVSFSFSPGLAKKVIVIDPGHGGSDPGAIGAGGLREKDVNLAVALQVKALLQKAGAKVTLTRETDVDVFGPNASDVEELKSRTTAANNQKADVFVSIHANSSVNRDVAGTSTYYYQKTPYDLMLAKAIQQEMLQAGGRPDLSVRSANFYVIKRTIVPSALVEMAFISNKGEEELLRSPQFQQKMAQGIVRGIEKFFVQASKQGGEE